MELLAIQRRRGGGGRCEERLRCDPRWRPRQCDRVARAYVTVTTEVCASSLYYFGTLLAPALCLRSRTQSARADLQISVSRCGRPPLRFAATETDI